MPPGGLRPRPSFPGDPSLRSRLTPTTSLGGRASPQVGAPDSPGLPRANPGKLRRTQSSATRPRHGGLSAGKQNPGPRATAPVEVGRPPRSAGPCLRSHGYVCVAAVSSFAPSSLPPSRHELPGGGPHRSPRRVVPPVPPAFCSCALRPRGDLRHVFPVVLHLPVQSALSALRRLPRPRPSRLAPP